MARAATASYRQRTRKVGTHLFFFLQTTKKKERERKILAAGGTYTGASLIKLTDEDGAEKQTRGKSHTGGRMQRRASLVC